MTEKEPESIKTESLDNKPDQRILSRVGTVFSKDGLGRRIGLNLAHLSLVFTMAMSAGNEANAASPIKIDNSDLDQTTSQQIDSTSSDESEETIFPKIVITKKEIIPVVSPVTLIPSTKREPIPAGSVITVVKQTQAAYQIKFGNETMYVNMNDVDLENNSEDEDINETNVEEKIETPQTREVIIIKSNGSRVRTESNTSSEILLIANENEELPFTGKIEKDESGATWYQVIVAEDLEDPSNSKLGWVHEIVVKQVVKRENTTSSGTGGNIDIQDSPNISQSETISTTETISESLSPAQDSMNRSLPENFREFYEAKGGTVTWNTDLQVYEVAFKTDAGEKKFVLLPKTGAKITDEADLEEGLYHLGETASLKLETEVDGEKIEQAFHFVVSPNFPHFEGNDFWENFPASLGQTPEITISTMTEEQRTEIAKALVEVFGFDEDKSFNLFITIAGEVKGNVDKSSDKPRQIHSLYEDGNDYELTLLDITNANTSKDTLITTFYPIQDYLAKNNLLNPEYEAYFGNNFLWSALGRIVEGSAWRSVEENKQFSNPDKFAQYYEENFANLIYDIEGQLTTKNNGDYVPVFNINLAQQLTEAYKSYLSRN